MAESIFKKKLGKCINLDTFEKTLDMSNKAYQLVFFLLLGLVSFLLRAQQTDKGQAARIEGKTVGIQFSDASFEKAMEQAKRENKHVFVAFYTTWCGPCKYMDKTVFTDSAVGRLYNHHFVCLHVDAEAGQGVALSKQFEIKAFPTMLFFDPHQLQRLLLRKVGLCDVPTFIKLGNNVLAGDTSYQEATRAVDQQDFVVSPNNFSTVLGGISDRQRVDSLLGHYFQQTDTSYWLSDPYWRLLSEHLYAFTSPLFAFVIHHRADFTQRYGQEAVNGFIDRLFLYGFSTPSLLGDSLAKDLDLMKARQRVHVMASAFDVELADKQWLNAEVLTLTFDVIRLNNKPSVWSALLDKTQQYQVLYHDAERSLAVAMNLINPHLNPTLDLKKTIRAIKRLHHPFGDTMLQSLAVAYVKTGQAEKANTVRRLAGLND